MDVNPLVEKIVREECANDEATARRILARIATITLREELDALVLPHLIEEELLDCVGPEDPVMDQIRHKLRGGPSTPVVPADLPAYGPLCVAGYAKPDGYKS